MPLEYPELEGLYLCQCKVVFFISYRKIVSFKTKSLVGKFLY